MLSGAYGGYAANDYIHGVYGREVHVMLAKNQSSGRGCGTSGFSYNPFCLV